MILYQQYDTEEWQGIKEAAKIVAMKEANDNVVKYEKHCKEMEDILNEDNDSIDSDDPYADRESCGNEDDMYPMNFIERFFEALVYNYVFDAGFLIDNDNGICYCPCCRNVSSKWMNHFQIELPNGCSDYCHKGSFKTPQDLMNHLDNVGENSFLHRSIASYLRLVHKEFFQKKKRTNQRKRTESHNRVLATETPNCELSCYQKEEISNHVQGREFMKIVDNNWRKRQIEVEGKKKKEERAENKTAVDFKVAMAESLAPSATEASAKPPPKATVMKTATGEATANSIAPLSTSAKPPPKATVMKAATGVATAESIAPLSTAASNQHEVEKKNTTATGKLLDFILKIRS